MVNEDKRSTLRKRAVSSTTKAKQHHDTTIAADSAAPKRKLRKELPDVEYLLKYGDPSRPTPMSEQFAYFAILILVFGISSFIFYYFFYRHTVPEHKFTLPQVGRQPN